MKQGINFNRDKQLQGLPDSVRAGLSALGGLALILVIISSLYQSRMSEIEAQVTALPKQVTLQQKHIRAIAADRETLLAQQDPDALEQAKATLKQYESLQQALSTRKGKLPFESVLSALTYHGVEGVYLTKLSISVEGELMIKGKASSTSRVAALQARLSALPPINKVRFNDVRVEREEAETGFSFSFSTRQGGSHE